MLLRLTTAPTIVVLMMAANIQIRINIPPSRSGSSLPRSASRLRSRQSLYQPYSAAGMTKGYIVSAHAMPLYPSAG